MECAPRCAHRVCFAHILCWHAEAGGSAGLAASEAASLASYGHLRRAEALQRKSLLEREHLSKTLDFLDPLSDDIPRGAWSIRRDATSNVVTIRSLQWPGSYAYHVAGTPNFGYAYFGFGEKNSDIGFAL
eukprot:TRINITY_DN5261_c0_g1_i1.p3 TRINITY_DN5261_c0_g1~~TRINITY_DN5261_c0_g1_i1.p3  ORF type:complete len:130 (-),score=19.16 TRINITY_DN5261_c0_g1_i1:298-687(-)